MKKDSIKIFKYLSDKSRLLIISNLKESPLYVELLSEKEVNIIIADFHDDFCTIRREMIAFNILERHNNIYKLVNKEGESI
ncbi:DUF2087 domain-containing protein [Clostridium sp. YIM B02515]|uniref:DUF2087 domain-containing protein n=1 Tax=Clostridium rhizosphaerae TaxID=2803861 RepID=A0ABS1T584_9CLOT|nr:DUF2087 domain-containing protein [Clostridium rhizosphaerae]